MDLLLAVLNSVLTAMVLYLVRKIVETDTKVSVLEERIKNIEKMVEEIKKELKEEKRCKT